MASSSIADAEVSMNTIEKNLEDIYWRIVKKLESSNKKTENETRILQTKDLFDEDPAQWVFSVNCQTPFSFDSDIEWVKLPFSMKLAYFDNLEH